MPVPIPFLFSPSDAVVPCHFLNKVAILSSDPVEVYTRQQKGLGVHTLVCLVWISSLSIRHIQGLTERSKSISMLVRQVNLVMDHGYIKH
jgi:hypothetical protein